MLILFPLLYYSFYIWYMAYNQACRMKWPGLVFILVRDLIYSPCDKRDNNNQEKYIRYGPE